MAITDVLPAGTRLVPNISNVGSRVAGAANPLNLASSFTPMGVATAGLGAVSSIYSAKMQANAATKVAKTQTDAANRSADLQDAASRRSQNFLQDQAFRDELLSNKASQGQYKADVAGLRNAYAFSGDDAVNRRSEFDSVGRTASNVRGQRTNQMNYLRDLLGYGQPQESLNTYAAPAALQRSALIIPEDQEYLDPVAPRPV